jgi:Dolichyl-phosphate-mannose-protein mannosyltransferase
LFREAERGALSRQGPFIAFAFALFCLYTNGDILPFAATPDILLSATAFGAAACFFRIWRGAGIRTYVILGCILALGYLSKSVMLPAGVILLGILLLRRPGTRSHFRKVLLAGVVMLLLCAPQIVMVSLRVGHPSFGETGRLNYLWWVQGVRQYQGWTGTPGGDAPIHGPRLIMNNPEVLEFSQPIPGTYPLWYDPAYWYAGAKIRFDALQQWKTAKASLAFYKNYFPDLKYPLAGLAVFVVIALITRTKPSSAEVWFLLWPISSLLVYALFTTEVRYVAPWLVLFWVGACSALWTRNRLAERLLLILLAIVIITPRLIELNKAAPALAKPRGTSMDVRVAQELHNYGIRPGDPIAIVGTGFDHYYARIARARIVAQVTDPRDFWSFSPTGAAGVERALAEVGAKALIARFRPARFQTGDWHVVPDTPYSFLMLDRIPE